MAPTGRTAQFKCDFGLFDIATNTLCIDVTAELSHYEAAVSWLRDFMYSTEFTREAFVKCITLPRSLADHRCRLQDAIATRYNSLATPPRTVSDMLNAETVELAYSNDSIAWVFGRKRDLALTRALRTQIEENPSMVIATFEEIRRCRYVFDCVILP